MYAQDAELTVEHNVTDVDRSGARRQTDVKFTHRVQGITYTTLAECKKWKEKVSRDRIDVLATSVAELGASKGVMFTTTGYEPGAEAYAKAKGIELFVIRDLREDEWGAPGRLVSFWMHFYNASFGELNMESELLSFVSPPVVPRFDFRITPEGLLDDKLTLVSLDLDRRGPNLLSVLVDVRGRVLKLVRDGVDGLVPGGDKADLAIDVPVEIDLSLSPTRSLLVEGGRLDIGRITANLLVTIDQTHFEHDRGQNLDVALAIEHFVTKQKQIVIRHRDREHVDVFNLQHELGEPPDDVMTPDTLLRIELEPWVNPSPPKSEIRPGNRTRFEMPADGSSEWRIIVTERDDIN